MSGVPGEGAPIPPNAGTAGTPADERTSATYALVTASHCVEVTQMYVVHL